MRSPSSRKVRVLNVHLREEFRSMRPFRGHLTRALAVFAAVSMTIVFAPNAQAAAPEAPSSVTITRASTSLLIQWTAAIATPAVTAYTATAFSASSGGVAQGSCTTSTTSCTITALTNGVQSFVEVSATNGTAPDAVSSPRISGTPLGIPSVPRSINASGEDAAISTTWLAPADTGGSTISGYKAQAFTSPVGGIAVASCLTTGSSTLRCTMDSLTNGTTYYVSVFATNTNGDGPASLRDVAQAGALPSPPRLIEVDRGNGSLSVTWIEPAANGGNAVLLYTASARTTYSTQGEVVASCTSTGASCVMSGTTNATTYYISVTATTIVGESAPSSRVSIIGISPPSSPRLVRLERGNGFTRVSWSSPLTTGGSAVKRYIAKAYLTATGGESVATCIPQSSSPTQCNLGPLPNGTNYFVDVTAENAMLASDPSSPRLAIIPATQPTPPREVSASQESTGIRVRWRVPESDGGLVIASYLVTAWSTLTGGTKVGSCTTSGDSCVILGLEGAPVFIDVTAQHEAGTSSSSSPRVRLLITGAPTPPLSVVSNTVARTILVSWRPSADDQGSPITSYIANATDSAGKTAGTCTHVVTKTERMKGASSSRMLCLIRGLQKDSKYTVNVGAVNAITTTYASASVISLKSSVPSIPRDLTLMPGEKSVFAQATLSASTGGFAEDLYTFRAWSKPRGGVLTKKCSIQTHISVASPACVLTDLGNYRTYWVDAFASNELGDSAPTARMAIRPMASVPMAPLDFRASMTPDGFIARWIAPAFEGGYPLQKYIVRVKTDPKSSTITKQCTATAPTTTCEIGGVVSGTHLWIDVIAINPVGESPASIQLDRTVIDE